MNKMNKFIAFVCVMTFSIGAASAQFYLGPRVGLNMSNMSWNTAGVDNISEMGFHGGATARYQFMKKLSVQMDAMVSTMGNKQKLIQTSDAGTTTTETTTKSMYVQVPIYISFERPIMPDNLVPYRVKKTSASFHLYGGGFFGYALSATQGTKLSVDNVLVTPAIQGDIDSKNYNAIDFGIMGGLGMSFKMDEHDTKRIGLDARYFLGMSNFDKRAGYTATNSAIQISVMFTQKLTKRLYTTRHKR
ncbi:MAG: hypothetical protein ACI9JN_000413 [Bacteroidia bacterium]|jgi:hypothetical protein